MRSTRRIASATGIAGGLLFAIHISIPNCGNWPFLWPAIAGATAVWRATRDAHPHRGRTGLTVALGTAAITGVVAFLGIAAVVYTVVHTGIAPALRQTGASPSGVPASATAAITTGPAGALAALALVVAFVAGVLVLPVRHFRTRRAHA